MRNVLIKLSNLIGAAIVVSCVIVAIVFLIPLFFIISLGTTLIFDKNGKRKYKGAEEFIDALKDYLENFVDKK